MTGRHVSPGRCTVGETQTSHQGSSSLVQLGVLGVQYSNFVTLACASRSPTRAVPRRSKYVLHYRRTTDCVVRL
eukprot:2369587-Prymnesium_polylepis.1